MTPSELKAEITNDPMTLGLGAPYTAGNNSEVVRLLNDPRFTQRRNVSLEALFKFIDQQPYLWVAIMDHSKSVGGTNGVKAAKQAVEWRAHAQYNNVNVDDAAFIGALDALVTDGILTADHKAGILALADAAASRAEVLWGAGTTVRREDVIAARSAA